MKNCAHNALLLTDKKASINQAKCAGCGRCISICPRDAIYAELNEANDILNRKTAEYTWAVLDGRPHFHITLVTEVSPFCDCHGENDIPIVPNVGMFASFDPVALDVACTDAVNSQPVMPGSLLAQIDHAHQDYFKAIGPSTDWHSMIDHAVKMGIGSKEYTLVQV